MRKYTLSAGTLLAVLSVPLMAQGQAPPASEEAQAAPEPPPETQRHQLTADQQVNFDSWPAAQQASYVAWPSDVQAYYWTLPEPRQDAFWRLTDNDKVALTRMEPGNRAEAWQLVERRLQGSPDVDPAPMQDKSDGS